MMLFKDIYIRMVMEGTRCQILDGRHEQGVHAKAACTLTNTIILNTIKHAARPTSKGMRHEQECETPAPVYVGMKL